MSQLDVTETRIATASAPAAAAPRPHATHQVGLFTSELRILFRRTRNRVLLAVLAVIPIAIGAAIKASTRHDGGGSGGGFINQVSNNGLFLVFAAELLTLPFFLPLAIGVVSGDAIAGESNQGTLRYLLVAPAGRTRLLMAKLTASLLFCLVATLVVAVAGLATGAALFPLGKVTLLSGTQISFGNALVRAIVVGLVVAASLVSVAAIGLFVSTLTDTPIAAMATTVGLVITAQIVQNIPQLSAVHPWLFSDQWLSFGDLLRSPIYTHNVIHNLLIQGAYLAVFGSAAWARFTSRDVLS